MLTIKQLKEELSKFKDTDYVFAYEGEVTGLIVERENAKKKGVIYCGEEDEYNKETITIKEEYIMTDFEKLKQVFNEIGVPYRITISYPDEEDFVIQVHSQFNDDILQYIFTSEQKFKEVQ